MKISNLLPLIGAVALCANICAVADDNAAQAAARAALMQKMNDLDSQQAEPAPNQPPPSAPVETQPVMPPSAPESSAPVEPPPLEATPVAPEAQPAPAPVEVQPETPVAPAAPDIVAPMSMTNSVKPSEPPLNVEAQDAQPKNTPPALHEMPVPPPTSLPPMESALKNYTPIQQLPPRTMNYPGKKFGFKPIEPPPVPVSPEKEAALRALLEQYKADQITPEQYQVQRAEILNTP